MVTSCDSLTTVDLTAALRQHFGFESFQPGQQEVIEHLLAGRSAAAVFPTGAGKSLCYQLPALILPGLTLVISPLIALMKDQIDALKARGIAAGRLDSTLTADEYRSVMQEMRSGRLRLLYVAPERLNNERFRDAIERERVALFAVDEAHCISEWGHNFRPDYLKLAVFARQCGAERVLALTATATEPVLSDICRLFAILPEAAVRTGFYRPNLTILTNSISSDGQRDRELLDALQSRPSGPTIVYVTLQRTAEALADRLAKSGLEARPYHAGLDDQVRADVQDWFMSSDRAIVVATIAFGMGIDKANIRYVYHYNLAKSLENFSQEIGRAGRDGNPAICQSLVSPDDLNVLENFIYGDTPTVEAVEDFVEGLFSQGDRFDVSLHELSARHDIRILVVHTLLVYLELDGYITGGMPFYSIYQIKPLQSSAEILARFSGERQEFLRNLFRQARPAKTWLHIDVAHAAATLGSPRDRVVRALDYLAEQQWLEVKAAGVRQRYERIKTPPDRSALVQELHQRTLRREAHELQRLHQMLNLTILDGCQVSALAAHFGQQLDHACGHCSWCLSGQQPMRLPERSPIAVDSRLWHEALELRHAHPQVLSDSRCLARLLCGTSSPRLVSAKLTRHPLFGALGHVPFKQVLAKAEDAVTMTNDEIPNDERMTNVE